MWLSRDMLTFGYEFLDGRDPTFFLFFIVQNKHELLEEK